jgi:NADPH:quinone reductase-like Zn-dependent oxidoreductase
MKIWQLQARPEAGSSILLASGEAPSAPLGPLDVAVRIHAVSLNYRDVLVARSARATPLVPLSDGAGEVIEVGDAVTHLQRGDRVMANFFPHWRHGELSAYDHTTALGGGTSDGMLREEVVLPAHAWVKVPRGWSFEEAAALPCAGLTAWQALFEARRLRRRRCQQIRWSTPTDGPVDVGPPSPASPLPANSLVDADGRAR